MIDSTLVRELRLGARRLLRTPAFTLLAALCLAVGFGSVITILALVNGLFLRPLPGIERPDDLVTLHFEGPTSVPNLADVREGASTLSGVGAFTADLATVRVTDLAERVLATAVTADYFRVLGTQPALGRFFGPGEDAPPGAHPVAVVSHEFWRRRMSGDPGALRTSVWVNGTQLSVVGVAPPGFLGTFTGFPVDVWVPLSMADVVAPGFDATDRADGGLEFVARLAPEATLTSARVELSGLASRLEAAYPEANRAFRIDALAFTGFDEEVRMPVLALLGVLLASAGLVLIIACLNFTNMLLARSAERTRDAAIRRALGVERMELLTSLVTENLLLALLGAGGGLVVAGWLAEALIGFVQVLPIRIHVELGLDWRVMGASVGLAALVALATALLPAARVSGVDLTTILRGTALSVRGGSRVLRLLLGAQLAGSVALLVVAGLFLQAVRRATGLDLGFETDDVRVVSFLDASLVGVQEGELAEFFERLADQARAVPGVMDAAIASSLPMAFGGHAATRIGIPGRELPEGETGFEATMAVVSPGYLRTLGIPLVSGRPLATEDGPMSAPVAVVSRAMAERFWPGQEPVGLTFDHLGTELRIVGVAESVAEQMDGTPGVTFYLSHAQRPDADMNLVLRGAPGAAAISAGVSAALRNLSADLPVVEPQPLEELLLLSLLPQRVASTVGSGLGAAGLLLAALGVYGMVAFSITRRTREIGIRIAVGASRGAVLGLVFADILRLAVWGVGTGLALALGVGQVVESLLVGISPFDPVAFATGAAAVVGFVVMATVVPARRAAGLDPRVALTGE